MESRPKFAWTRLLLTLGVMVAALAWGRLPRSNAAPPKVDESAVESARFLLTQAVTVGQDRTFHEMLRALRHLRDPALRPLFEDLAGSSRAVLQIHGILGLAEASPPDSAGRRKIDLKLLVTVTDPLAQAELISAALDDELLDLAACEQLVASDGLDPAVRLLVGNELVHRGKAAPTALLDDAIKSDNPGRKYLAALLRLQMGDAKASDVLGELNKLDDAKRDGVRLMVLETALKYEFDRIGPWALEVAGEPGLNVRLAAAALRVALRFNAPGADELWQRMFQSSTDPAQQVQLAMTLLRLGPWIKPSVYATLKGQGDPLLRQMGVVGEAIASKQPVAPAAMALIQLYNPTANRVMMGYADEQASPDDAKLILLGLILAYDQGPKQLRSRMLEDAVTATQMLYEKAPDDAVAMLRPIISDPASDERLVHAILVGLIRTQATGAERVISGLPAFGNPHLDNMAVVLKSKSPLQMTEAELNELALVVRGGGRLQETLRVQAAWSYLKRIGRADAVLASVIKG